MIIYKGWGTILLFAFPALIGLVVWLVSPSTMADHIAFGITMLLAAIPIWFAGRKLNADKEVYLNKAGEQVESSPHTCFFIPIEYWAFASFGFGLYLLFL